MIEANRTMSSKGTTTVSALAIIAFAVAASMSHVSANSEFEVPLSTPAGITLQPLGKFQGYGLDQETAALNGHDEIAYADARGMTLYTYAEDSHEKSVCVDECAEIWPPAIAAEGSTPVGAWSIFERHDGSRQWALNGKPLYTYTKDIDIGSVGGNSPKRYGRGPNIGERGAQLAPIPDDVPLPEGLECGLAASSLYRESAARYNDSRNSGCERLSIGRERRSNAVCV